MCSDGDTVRALEPFLHEYDVCVSHSVVVSAGCFLLLHKRLNCTSLAYVIDTEGRFICCDFNLQGVLWHLICVYATNASCHRHSLLWNCLPI